MLNILQEAAPRHRITRIGVPASGNHLTKHLDDLAADGWMPFHIHEAAADDAPHLLIFSQKTTDTRTLILKTLQAFVAKVEDRATMDGNLHVVIRAVLSEWEQKLQGA